MDIEQKVKQTLKNIELSKKDKILVAMSGGKDSSVVAYLLKKLGYKVEGFHINLGMGSYSERCLNAVKELCNQLGIKLHLYDIKKEMGNSMCYLRNAIQTNENGKELKNCAICGVIKKWIMNREARKIHGISAIATGHNLDDESQTFLINILKGSLPLSAHSGVKTKNIADRKFIARIKPLFYIAEDDIREFSKKMKLPVVYEKCPCALDSYRIQIRQFTNTLETGEKENIMKNFDILFPRIQKLKSKEGLRYCEICGEPSRNSICRMCQLMKIK